MGVRCCSGNAAEAVILGNLTYILGFQPTPPANTTPFVAVCSSELLLSNHLQHKINIVYHLTVARVTYWDFNIRLEEEVRNQAERHSNE